MTFCPHTLGHVQLAALVLVPRPPIDGTIHIRSTAAVLEPAQPAARDLVYVGRNTLRGLCHGCDFVCCLVRDRRWIERTVLRVALRIEKCKINTLLMRICLHRNTILIGNKVERTRTI